MIHSTTNAEHLAPVPFYEMRLPVAQNGTEVTVLRLC